MRIMKTKLNNKVVAGAFALLLPLSTFLFSSCSEDDLGPSIYDTTEYPLDRSLYTFPLDTFVKKNFLEPYNLKFIYKMEDVGTDMQKNLVPATYEKSVDLAVLTKFLWLDVYAKLAGEKEIFLKKYSPRIIHVIGSPGYNSDGSRTVGVAEGGIKVGPFQGLSAKVSLGYAIVKKQPGILYRNDYPSQALMLGMMSTYMVLDSRGYYLNAEVNYKYRSLIEASASVKYAPHDNELFEADNHYNGYKLGVDRASTVANIDLKVTPWRPLTINAGLEYRGGRMALFGDKWDADGDRLYEFVKMKDAVNLKAGANYRLNSSVNLWLQAHNLLNRRYDILYGMGAQRIGFMVGAGFTF